MSGVWWGDVGVCVVCCGGATTSDIYEYFLLLTLLED